MKLIPVYTEKSTRLAKEGKYTFMVDLTSTKKAIKKALLSVFDVHATDVRTVRTHVENKRSARGGKITIPAQKKAIVALKEGEKLDLFEEKSPGEITSDASHGIPLDALKELSNWEKNTLCIDLKEF